MTRKKILNRKTTPEIVEPDVVASIKQKSDIELIFEAADPDKLQADQLELYTKAGKLETDEEKKYATRFLKGWTI